MKGKQQPVVGAWYVNTNCQFLRVWAMVFNKGKPQRVVLSYLNGHRQYVDVSEWYELDLKRYPQRKHKHESPSTSMA